ncbi:MAG TPA: DUF1800 domain-containing protein [Cyclobacteriaceae bacterium]|jgi:uncharacterized protein (DUF1800 family)|nr:DUF1800 domain-containing protein [Cytophagales bacterium]HNT48941.1 DUF1800 domain-containing protein [Cyclobacteriaceae bacterium]HRE65839.1 DUF1800 domain-containing protein [Cyclobacteriaceae bacterium]HRF33683.1 DUF1800 domain-containing protein [Cyclobacteriaceae bacterium]
MINNAHLHNRAAFGVSVVASNLKTGKELFKNNTQNKPLQVVVKPELDLQDMKSLSAEDRKKIFQKSRKQVLELNVAWLQQMTDPQVALREKMTFFWHDHFACRTQVAFLAQQLNNTIRKHALGSFKNLLMAVSKDPAMLQFLNNQQNKKDSPNENFAREVMELFTLGRGNYTEEDIKNAARAFTGWASNPLTGEFVFRERVHDAGQKIFKGKSGNFSGEEIIDMLLDDPQTATFITTKIWNYFVSQEVQDQEVIKSLAKDFYNSGYDIEKLMMQIFQSEWFYELRFVGNRIKSPVELLTGIQLHTAGRFQDELSPLFIQRTLSQVLFYPPNVGGWPQGKEWIDSSSLTFRLSLPGILLRNESTDIQAKDDGDVNNLINQPRKSTVTFSVNWSLLANRFASGGSEENLEAVEQFLLMRPTSKDNKTMISRFAAAGSNETEFIQRAFTAYMSLPEYQLN